MNNEYKITTKTYKEPDNEAWLSFIKQYEKDLINMKIIQKDK